MRQLHHIFGAKDSDYCKAKQRIFRTATAPAHVELPVLEH
jgi:hypothetical protein